LPPVLALDTPECFESFFVEQQLFETTLSGDSVSGVQVKDATRLKFAKTVGLESISDYRELNQVAGKMMTDSGIPFGRTQASSRREARERAVERLKKGLRADSYNRLRAYILSTYKIASGAAQ